MLQITPRKVRLGVWKTVNVLVAIATVAQLSFFGYGLKPQTVQAVTTAPVNNPALQQSCGLDIGLVADLSGSVEDGDLTLMKSALTNFVSSLNSTTNQFSLVKFGTNATLVREFSANNGSLINTDINGFSIDSDAHTNWDAALARSAESFNPEPRPANANLIVIATDGSPNRYGDPAAQIFSYPDGITNAIPRADGIKTAGTRIVVIGIGNDTGDPSTAEEKLDKMKAISGPNVATTLGAITVTTDVIKVDSFENVGAAFASYAHALCPGSITVNKMVDTTGSGTYTEGNAMGFTWTMDGGNANAMGATVNATSGNHSINESLVNNYQFVGWYDTNNEGASCSNTRSLSGTTLPISKNIEAEQRATITLCNRFVPVPPSLTITKSNNITTFVNPGATVTYTVIVSNSASVTETAKSVVLTDLLPAGFTYSVGGGSTKNFDLGDIAPGKSVTTTYAAIVSTSQASGNYTNTAKAKGLNTTEVSATSKVEVRVPIVLGVTSAPVLTPAITLTKTINATQINPGKTATYTMVVKNTGTGNATNVVLTDTLPVGFTFVDGGKDTKSWTIGTLTAGASKTITARVIAAKDIKAGTYTNRAFVTADGLDPINAQVSVKVVVPKVLGLATTGPGFRDLILFMAGLMLTMAGFYTARRNLRWHRVIA